MYKQKLGPFDVYHLIYHYFPETSFPFKYVHFSNTRKKRNSVACKKVFIFVPWKICCSRFPNAFGGRRNDIFFVDFMEHNDCSLRNIRVREIYSCIFIIILGIMEMYNLYFWWFSDVVFTNFLPFLKWMYEKEPYNEYQY